MVGVDLTPGKAPKKSLAGVGIELRTLGGAHTWQYFGPETLLVHWQRCHKNCYESNKKELAGQRTRSATFLGLATFLARNIATCAPRQRR